MLSKIVIKMLRDFSLDTQNLDLDYLYTELEVLKDSLEVPYIDKRARENGLNEDLFEEVKIAFNEISKKEKGMKQLIQIMEFTLQKYSDLSDKHQDTQDKLVRVESELADYKENVVVNMSNQLQRNENNLEDLEEELINAEREIRELKEQISSSKPEVTIFKNIQEMEKRVRRQSLMETRGQIDGLEQALQTTKSNNQKIQNKLQSLKEEIIVLSKENKKLKRDLQNAYDNNETIARDVQELNKMKAAFEVEFTNVVDSKENEIKQLNKKIEHLQEERKRSDKKNKELEGKLSKFKNRTVQSSSEANPEVQGESIENTSSNKGDAIKVEENGSENSIEEMFDGVIREEPNYKRSNTYESLGEVMGNRNSYYGRDTMNILNEAEEEELVSEEGIESHVDVGTQTIEENTDLDTPLRVIEEEKFHPSYQDNDYELDSNYS